MAKGPAKKPTMKVDTDPCAWTEVLYRAIVHYACYVPGIVMWPWPMGAADHTGRHVDRSHITDWLRWGCLRLCWTERRLSW